MKNKFIITVPFYNVEKYITNCIESIKKQLYENYICILTNDNSQDRSYEIGRDIIRNDNRFILINNRQKQDAMHNLVNAINISNPSDEDIIVNVDGDDWLAHENVLDIVNSTYNNKDILMTYGNYLIYPYNEIGICTEYPKEIVENNLFRKDIYRARHLRTFKYKLWKNIKEKDLKDDNGDWMFPCCDQTFMFPMLEMCGGRFHCFTDILYIYNKENPLNAWKINRKKQVDNENITRNRPPYKKMDFS